MRNYKNIFRYALIAVFAMGAVSCSQNEGEEQDEFNFAKDLEAYIALNTENAWYTTENSIAGNALGTSLTLKTGDDTLLISPKEIDAFITAFNKELSTYDPNSLISQFNQGEAIDLSETQYFKTCFDQSQEIYEITNGAFDPTVFPLVNLWGFVDGPDELPSQDKIDEVLEYIGFTEGELYDYKDGVLTKKDPRMELVFNAIAKGQAVDELATILDAKGQKSYYLEIGGEMKLKGLSDRNLKWIVGIDIPVETNSGLAQDLHRDIENYVEITGKAMATSGNYRDFYELDGEIYSHTLSPKTGKPVRREILSATVVSDNVAQADAFATAFMVMGVEKSLNLIKENPSLGIEAYLLYDSGDGSLRRAYSRGMVHYLMDK